VTFHLHILEFKKKNYPLEGRKQLPLFVRLCERRLEVSCDDADLGHVVGHLASRKAWAFKQILRGPWSKGRVGPNGGGLRDRVSKDVGKLFLVQLDVIKDELRPCFGHHWLRWSLRCCICCLCFGI